jgi:glutamate N-acetyltransferase / amino-acid N-acetyltransferase
MQLPQGFRGSGVAAGIKSTGAKDLTLIVNDGPQLFGTAVFTTNKVEAAPVTWSRQVVQDLQVNAAILNSGGANACTGPEGFADTHKTAEHTAEVLGISSSDVVVASTGMIGIRLPMTQLLSGVDSAVTGLTTDSGIALAEGIMTTDSHPKFHSSSINGVTVFGIAKGAGMLAPSLATMLSVVLTDAVVEPVQAKKIFEKVVERTYNRIDSDGCTSTNDTVLLMASGASGISLSDQDLEGLLTQCCSDLSYQLIADAEGHSKIIQISVIGAANEEDAVAIGRACARNNLLKCAIHGEDANWGRVLAAVGTVDAAMDGQNIDVSLNGVMVCQASAPAESRDLVVMNEKQVKIVIDLHVGNASATVWTNDLTAMYVHENSAYSS